jgi:hypothetical protein
MVNGVQKSSDAGARCHNPEKRRFDALEIRPDTRQKHFDDSSIRDNAEKGRPNAVVRCSDMGKGRPSLQKNRRLEERSSGDRWRRKRPQKGVKAREVKRSTGRNIPER